MPSEPVVKERIVKPVRPITNETPLDPEEGLRQIKERAEAVIKKIKSSRLCNPLDFRENWRE